MATPITSAQLSAEDVCRILESCGKSRVLRLEYHGLTVQFAPEGYQPPSEAGGRSASPVSREDEARLLAEHESRLKQEELENLKLSNPELYEELVMQNQLSSPYPEDDSQPTIAQ